MRWTKKYKRYVKRFAIFPIKIRDEMVWLETVYLEQKWDQYEWLWPVWIDVKFLTKEEYEKIQSKSTDAPTLSAEASKLYKELKEAIWNDR